jgi:hypothetical protein
VIAISVIVADSVLQGDTLHAHATVLDAGGDSVVTPIHWTSFDTTIVGVVDSTGGTFVGKNAGTTNIQARAGALPSNPVPITVVAPPPPPSPTR